MADLPGGYVPPAQPDGAMFFGTGAGPSPPPPVYGGPTPSPGRRPNRLVELGLSLAMVAGVAGIALIALGPGTDAGAVVTTAVTSAIGDQTATIHLAETVTADGQSVSINGSGSVDFTSAAMEAKVTGVEQGQPLDIEFVYLANSIYINIPQVTQVDGGKPWLSLDLSALGTSAANGVPGAGDNPTALLQTLAQQGNDVTSLGSATVDGQPVQGYSVTITPAAINNALNDSSLPDWLKAAAQQVKVQSGTVKVYVDDAGDLVQVTEGFSITAQGQTVNETTALDFSDYGTSVSITPPPADQVESFQDFLQSVASSATS